MIADPLTPQTRLRTRVTAFFVVAALPAVVLSAAAVFWLDRLVGAEIEARIRETTLEAERILDDERARVSKAVAAVATEDAVRAFATDVTQGDRIDEDLARKLAAAHGLDLLALVPLVGPQADTIASSAHLSGAVGDPAPTFALEPGDGAPVGVVHDLVDDNPPRIVAALVATRVIDVAGRGALVVYGGARLDGHRLDHVARAGQATLVLRSAGIRPSVFPKDAAPAARGQPPRQIIIASLPEGRALTEPGMAASDAPTQLEVYAHTERLQRARVLIRWSAAALGGAALLAALLAGAFLSRRITGPIVELSEAARRVGAGDLEVDLAPRSLDEVGTLVRVFNRMTQELSEGRQQLARAERVAAWQQIARRVAHEIKNPLFPIQMSMETLRKSYDKRHPKLDEIMEESTQTVLDEVRALNRIVTEFSDFARLPTPRKKPEDPVEVLRHICGLYRGGPDDPAGVQVTLDPDKLEGRALRTVYADREQITRALINLVKNAIEAMPEGGAIELDAEAGPRAGRDGVWFRVRDEGPGMPADVQAQIFTPYFTTKAEGTGLGLAIVARITEEHAGTVEVEDNPSGGTTVSLWLPCDPELEESLSDPERKPR